MYLKYQLIEYLPVKYFLLFCRLPFHFADCFSWRSFLFDVFHLIFFCCSCFQCCQIQNVIAKTSVKELFPVFSSRSFMVSGLTFECLIHFELSFRASLVAQRLKHLPAMWEIWVQSLGREDPWRRKWQPTPVFLPGKSHGWRSLVGYRVAKSRTQLSDFTFAFKKILANRI